MLYLTDGDAHLVHTRGTVDFLAQNGLMPQVILVGIPNTNRTRDLTPTQEVRPGPDGVAVPQGGGAGKFLDFFETELFPFVEATYRTAPYRIFAGHSLGGTLSLHILLERPELFHAYLSVSPYLGWDHQLLLRRLPETLMLRKELKRTLFVTMADEEAGRPRPHSFDHLQTLLKSVKAKGFAWEARALPEEDHGTVVLRSHELGLRRIFDGWRLPVDRQTGAFQGGLQELQAHYAALGQRLGYPVEAPEQTVNLLGYQHLGRKEFEAALGAFRYNLACHPASANAYDSLGEGLEQAGRLTEAKAAYAQAVALGEKGSHPFLATYRRNLARLTERVP